MENCLKIVLEKTDDVENTLTSFGYEKRRAHFSSLILTGQMTRAEALERISKPELDEHFLLARRGANLGRERLVYALLPCVRIDGLPQRFARLVRLREHVPVVADALMRGNCSPVKRDVVFACAPMVD